MSYGTHRSTPAGVRRRRVEYVDDICYEISRSRVCRLDLGCLDETGICKLAGALCKSNVTKLVLHAGGEQEHQDECCSVLRELLQKLSETEVCHLEIESIFLDSSCIDSLISWFHSGSCKLEWLGLSRTRLESVDGSVWRALFQSLRSLRQLRALDLTDCHISPREVGHLSQFLIHSTTMESLILTENKIGDEGVNMLSSAMTCHPRMQIVALGDCAFTVKGLGSLVRLLHQNAMLQRLYIFGNDIDYNGKLKEELNFWLELNVAGRASFRSAATNPNCVPKLCDKASQESPSVLYGLLKENPGLWLQGHTS